MPAPLFDSDRLCQFVHEVGVGGKRAAEALDILERLLARREDGTLAALSETRVEQAFNERFFSELFGYTTLLRTGQGLYHLQPKHPQQAGRVDDFSLGFFGPKGGDPIVSCELKSADTDLDAPQHGASYRGLSPVQQALRAVEGSPSVRWVLVTNFDELRLYRAGDPEHYHRESLSEVSTLRDAERVMALFSRTSLLGTDESQRASPVERLFLREIPLMVPARPGSPRLLQRMRPRERLTTELPLHTLHDALEQGARAERGGQGIWPTHDVSPVLRGDRLVADDGRDGDYRRTIEITTSGVLTASRYLSTGQPLLHAKTLALEVARFLRFARPVDLGVPGPVPFEVSWTLLDVGEAQCMVEDGWSSFNIDPDFSITPGVTKVEPPPVPFDRSLQNTAQLTRDAVRALLYPFEGRDPFQKGKIARVNPSLEHIARLLRAAGLPL